MTLAWLQILVLLTVTGTPLFLSVMVDRVASAEAGVPRGGFFPRFLRRLLVGTTVGVWAVLILALVFDRESIGRPWFTQGPLMAFVALGALAALGVRDVYRASEARVRAQAETGEKARHASLVPRRITRYLGWPALLSPYLVTLAGWIVLAARLGGTPGFSRALGFALCPLAFHLMYALWLYNEACGAQRLAANATDDVEAMRGERVRRVFRYQLGLAAMFAGVGALVATVDLTSETARMVSVAAIFATAIVGLVAAALFASSEFTRRAQETRGRAILR